jgi:membrane-associated protease RseP (regulator of RpoE activity)
MRSAVRRRGLGLVLGLFVLGLAAPSFAAPTRAWLGVTTQSVTEDLRDALDLSGDGVLVNSVVSDSPADRAGIRKGDIITSVNSQSVRSPGQLAEVVRSQSVGSNAAVRVIRRGGTQTINVRLGTRPSSLDEDEGGDWYAPDRDGTPRVRAFKNGKEVDPEDFDFEFPNLRGMRDLGGLGDFRGMNYWGRPRLGVRIEKMNPDLASYFGGTNGRGALVVEVIDDTPAEKAGIKAGDVITAVGNTSVDDANDLMKALADEEGNVSLSIVRKGTRRTIEADLGDAPRRSTTWRMRDGRAPRAQGSEDLTPSPKDDDEVRELRRQIQELRDELREMKGKEDRNR